ncbi:MAG: CRISPR-associated endonuclease Cas2 [Blastocatellia bacterium]|nr:CRISPR-associated endonuclease Cas2 [Blastocatellia bacterium]
MYVLVVYDIANQRRLQKIAALLERYGLRIQRSVFECELNPPQIAQLCAEIKAVMNRKQDRVQLYPLCRECQTKNCSCNPQTQFVIVL